jgi:hypothetical protein
MEWDGSERRVANRSDFCAGHIKLCEDVAVIKTTVINLDKRINGSIGEIQSHINSSRPRIFAVVGIGITILIFLFNMAISLGENHRQIQVNTDRLLVLEKHGK